MLLQVLLLKDIGNLFVCFFWLIFSRSEEVVALDISGGFYGL